MVSTRRSARNSGSGSVQPEEAPSEPASGGAAPPAVSLQHSREASLHPEPNPAREIGGSQTDAAIPNDKALNHPVEAEENGSKGKESVVVEGHDEVDGHEESLEESPGWLPDGWIMEAHKADNGSIHWYYTSPISGDTFSSKAEALHYLFSGMDERFLESKACTEHNELHRSHMWLPDRWMIEVRAGGKEMDKMYKFYVHLPTGKRFLSKGDVLHYANVGEVSSCDMDVLCDTSTDDNVLAHLEFNPDGLPDGWVKEVIFRNNSSSKSNDGVRKDLYYTDPVSRYVFRTLRSVRSYLESGEISSQAYLPRRSVTDLYLFDICADLPQSMLKRLKVGQTKKKSVAAPILDKDPIGQTSNHTEGATSAGAGLLPQSGPKRDKCEFLKASKRKRVSSDFLDNGKGLPTLVSDTMSRVSSDSNKQPGGGPKNISKKADQSTLECDTNSHKETKHVDVKLQMDMMHADDIPNEKTLKCAAKEKHTTVIEQAFNNLAGGDLLTIDQNNQESVAASHLHEQENEKLIDIRRKVKSLAKFYTRRYNQARSSNNG